VRLCDVSNHHNRLGGSPIQIVNNVPGYYR
jgi:hypothetical protein